MVELRRAVLNLGESKLEILVRDQDKGRTVIIHWKSKHASDLPPRNWAAQVDVESGIQRDYEKRVASGRPIL